ncbi:hypothetical protein OIU85_015089 [Salix viminalis]|uniref:Uncharacterized protein n=1 Tax=Salix viminalis TaxID=40686 RepID=A0A9Q0SBT5_SALVM|nr:hypothetical protein OIU85_015089 [Salix viminalis]
MSMLSVEKPRSRTDAYNLREKSLIFSQFNEMELAITEDGFVEDVDEHESLVNQKVKPKSARAKITSETQTRRWRSVTQVTGFVTLQVSDGKEWPVQMLLQGMIWKKRNCVLALSSGVLRVNITSFKNCCNISKGDPWNYECSASTQKTLQSRPSCWNIKRLRVEFDEGMGDSNLVGGNVCVFELIRLRALRAFIEGAQLVDVSDEG